MSDERDDDAKKPVPLAIDLSDDELAFIKEEGLDLLSAFHAIRDGRKRELVLELARAIVEAQRQTDGH